MAMLNNQSIYIYIIQDVNYNCPILSNIWGNKLNKHPWIPAKFGDRCPGFGSYPKKIRV